MSLLVALGRLSYCLDKGRRRKMWGGNLGFALGDLRKYLSFGLFHDKDGDRYIVLILCVERAKFYKVFDWGRYGDP